MASIPPEVQNEITRLKNEVHAKEETLNQLKLMTKAFADNMRGELATEKKKFTDLEEQLKHSKEAAENGTQAQPMAELEALKKEVAIVTHRENELKAKAKSFADNMKAQLQAEKDKTLAQTTIASSNASHDLLSLDDPPSSNKEELVAVQTQLQVTKEQLEAMNERLRTAEAMAAQRTQDALKAQTELESLRFSSEQQLERLQNGDHAEAAFAEEHSRLQEALGKTQETMHRLQQYKIENEHLQKQLQDKDFQLEQLESYRQKAEENEEKVKRMTGELSSLQSQLQTKSEEAAKSCTKCDELKIELTEISALYEKVNIGRSQSDIQLAEAQTALSSLQSV
ncbi:hypothetical protein FI667_g14788, partial [Globisporangium splendens]